MAAVSTLTDDWTTQLLQGLPSIPVPFGFTLGGSLVGNELKVQSVIAEIQKGASAEAIKTLLAYYHSFDATELRESVNAKVEGIPAIFYVIATDNIHLIRDWVKYGGDPNATFGPKDYPLLAFCVLHGGRTRTMQQATSTLETLLALGASPDAIP